jgi:hypothetical protein
VAGADVSVHEGAGRVKSPSCSFLGEVAAIEFNGMANGLLAIVRQMRW